MRRITLWKSPLYDSWLVPLCFSSSTGVHEARSHRDTENAFHMCRCHEKQTKDLRTIKGQQLSLKVLPHLRSKLETSHRHDLCASRYVAKSQFSNACDSASILLLSTPGPTVPVVPVTALVAAVLVPAIVIPAVPPSICTITTLTYLYLTSSRRGSTPGCGGDRGALVGAATTAHGNYESSVLYSHGTAWEINIILYPARHL